MSRMPTTIERGPESIELERYWRQSKCTDDAPLFTHFDPLQIPDLVSSLSILRVNPIENWEVSVSMLGTEPLKRGGSDFQGALLSNILDKESFDRLVDNLAKAWERQSGFVQQASNRYKSSPPITLISTTVPYRSEDNDEAFFVSVSSVSGYEQDKLPREKIEVQIVEDIFWLD